MKQTRTVRELGPQELIDLGRDGWSIVGARRSPVKYMQTIFDFERPEPEAEVVPAPQSPEQRLADWLEEYFGPNPSDVACEPNERQKEQWLFLGTKLYQFITEGRIR